MIPYLYAVIVALLMINIGLVVWLRMTSKALLRLNLELDSKRLEVRIVKGELEGALLELNAYRSSYTQQVDRNRELRDRIDELLPKKPKMTEDEKIISDSIGNFGPGGGFMP